MKSDESYDSSKAYVCSPIIFDKTNSEEDEGDEVDRAVQRYLREDDYGRSVALPFVKISKGLYMIGMLRYSLVLNDDEELVGASSGILLSEMIQKTHEK